MVMKITINDVPLSQAPKDGLYYHETVLDEQYARLAALGAAFRIVARDQRYFNIGEEIEAVKIEAAYINPELEITHIKFRIAFKPFLRYTGHLSPGTIRMSALWEVKNQELLYVDRDETSDISFPRNINQRFHLKKNDTEELIKLLFEALAKTIEKTSDPLQNEHFHLEEMANRVRRTDRSQKPAG